MQRERTQKVNKLDLAALSEVKRQFLEAEGHLLAVGGPGSGKTFIALVKADTEIVFGKLGPEQKILFLSFARSTVTRIAQQARKILAGDHRKHLEISTYHTFAWNIIRCYGNLLISKRIKLLPPPEAASILSGISDTDEALASEKMRLMTEEGLLHFDLFAYVTAELLSRSRSLSEIIGGAYPVIILDEFQDTNEHEWRMIRALAERSRVIALGDPGQRIYEFRGADPKRIPELISAYKPGFFDLSDENHRSSGTDIVQFGNDLLIGANKGKKYNHVEVGQYKILKGNGSHMRLKSEVLARMRKLRESGRCPWSIAVLVPTKQLMLDISQYLSAEQIFVKGSLPSINHEVSVDSEGPILSATLIAGLLESGSSPEHAEKRMVADLTAYIRGRRGEKTKPPKADLELSHALDQYIDSGLIRGKNRTFLVSECKSIAEKAKSLVHSGDPKADWLAVRELLAEAKFPLLAEVLQDVKVLRFLRKGDARQSSLNGIWKRNGNYAGAVTAVQNAFLREHFSSSSKTWEGVLVMTMHKSKGKEFDEVILYESRWHGRFNPPKGSPEHAKYAMRVAVTRAMTRAMIFTPAGDPCPFLF